MKLDAPFIKGCYNSDVTFLRSAIRNFLRREYHNAHIIITQKSLLMPSSQFAVSTHSGPSRENAAASCWGFSISFFYGGKYLPSLPICIRWIFWQIAENFVFGWTMFLSMGTIHGSLTSRGKVSLIWRVLAFESPYSIPLFGIPYRDFQNSHRPL